MNEKNDWFKSQYLRNWASQVAQVIKSLPANAGDTRDMGSIPRLGGSPGEGNGMANIIWSYWKKNLAEERINDNVLNVHQQMNE